MKNVDLYKTKDQFIASTLCAFGKKIISTEWEGSVCFFVFENLEDCKSIANKYYFGELKTDPKKLFDSFKTIKSMLFNKF